MKLGSEAYMSGRNHVALSRCKSIEGIEGIEGIELR
jgi:hypothetical protein